MARYRIGNDLTLVWSVKEKNGEPLPLNDKEVHLYYTCERGRYEADIQIQEGNVVVWTFLGKDQRTLGEYSLTLEIISPYGQRTIKDDRCNAFTLVCKSCEESEGEGDAVIDQAGTIRLATTLDIYKIQPVVPFIGKNETWVVDGVDTGKPARGEKGDAVDVAYVKFEVDDRMNLIVHYTTTNNDQMPKFKVDERGHLIISK